MMAAKRIPKALTGSAVIFHGFDGRDYAARVESVRKGVAVITYRVPAFEARIKTYISDPARLTVPKEA